MLLTVTTTHEPATDLGYLLHKNPARVLVSVPVRAIYCDSKRPFLPKREAAPDA